MVSPSDRLDRLRSFDLSEYGSRAYLALLELGTTEARDVSRMAKIPLAKVYSVLEALQAKGLCEIYPGSPKRYAAIPIEQFIERLVNEHDRASQALRSQVDELRGLFPFSEGASLNDRGRIQALNGRRSAMEHESKIIANAQGEIIMLCTPGRILRMRKLLPGLKSARDRGVKVRMMIPYSSTWEKDVETFSPLAQIRVRAYDEQPRSMGVSFVVNGTAGLIVDHIPDDASLMDGNDVGIQLASEGMVSALRDLLHQAWTNAPEQPATANAIRVG